MKVAVLFSSTGTTAYVERTQLNATLMAIQEVNLAGGIGGENVVPVVCDAQSNAGRFAELAERTLAEEAVRLIIGCYMTDTRQAIVPIVERRNALLVYPAPYEGFEYSPNVVYGGAVPNQHIVLLARHLLKNYGRRFYLVGTRYTFPIESNRVMMTLVSEQKGQIVAERYLPLNASRRQLEEIAKNIATTRPDVVFCTVVGEAVKAFYEICRDVGVDMRSTVFASLTITEAEVELLGAELATGIITAATYFESIESEENRRFVSAYRARYGSTARTNAMAESAYCLTHMVLGAVQRSGSLDPVLVRNELHGVMFSAPQGVIRMNSDNNHFYLWPRLGRVRMDGGFDILESATEAVRPDPYLINHQLDDCAFTSEIAGEL